MDTRKLIHDLGGVVFIGGAIGASPSAVGNWHVRGIPWRWRPAVAKLAAEKDVKVPDDFLIASPKAA